LPENSRGVEKVGHVQTPAFQLRRYRLSHIRIFFERKCAYVLPPFANVADLQVNDEVVGEFRLVAVAARAANCNESRFDGDKG